MTLKQRYATFRLLEIIKAMKTKIALGLLGLWVMFMPNPATVHACSVCITGASDPTADAFNWSIFFLMFMPYLVVGSIAGWLFYRYRKSLAEREKSEADQPLGQLALNPEESRR